MKQIMWVFDDNLNFFIYHRLVVLRIVSAATAYCFNVEMWGKISKLHMYHEKILTLSVGRFSSGLVD